MLKFARRWFLLALIAVGSLWLRVHDLAVRPMHADEANQAMKLGILLERGIYRFDRRDHHGPTLYYAALVPAWCRGQHTFAALTETTVRITPALFGVLGVLLVYALARPLGEGPALLATALVGLSPPAVYYSRFFIQETLLVTFMLGVLVCGRLWWRTGRLGWALMAGVCAGLLLATKESAMVYLDAMVLAILAVARPVPLMVVRQAGWAMLAAAVVSAMLYTSFLTDADGLDQAISALTYGLHRATGGATGHEKLWFYYFKLFMIGPGSSVSWHGLLYLGLCAGGAWAAWKSRDRLLRFVAVYAGLLTLVFAITPYKTPWNGVNLVPAYAILVAGGLGVLARRGLVGKCAAVALAGIVFASLAWQTRYAVFLAPSSADNTFAYVHSSPDVKKATALGARAGAGLVKVIAFEYWPLPWYLRAVPHVGYWNEPPANCDGALVFSSIELSNTVRARLHGRYREDFLGVRPGVILVVFTRQP